MKKKLYFDFPLTDGSRICVQRHEDLSLIPNLRADGIIPEHAHEFYEMVLIQTNSCRHLYREDVTTLLPGDLFLIPPHRTHAYRFTENVLHYNCQFFIDAISGEWLEDVRELTYDRLQPESDDELPAIGRRGILHLNREESFDIIQALERILAEQKSPRKDSERMKRSLLHLILAHLTRLREQRSITIGQAEHWKQQMISETLKDFENRLYAKWDIEALAERFHISSGYFRSIFREITGVPPLQYLNQMRINRAVDMIQHQGLSLHDASAAVGIHDINYFSRLCKQVTGYTPSHFRRNLADQPHQPVISNG